ncbi:hypothetical protein [Duganella sp. HH101]|uniref:hypothetical protein n=1 Tax=Duganella sp. HH101 TaxID=1781066 RepID=UPI000893AB2D|nr:hypothetical protein [Duganella sp. HH101]OFA04553.1 hypothetical protein DUGA2_20990 [Duganella sp. HH101]
MRYLRDLDNLIVKAIKSDVSKIPSFFIGLIVTFTAGSVFMMMNIGETPDIANQGVIALMIATELLCYVAIWIYVKKIPSRRS